MQNKNNLHLSKGACAEIFLLCLLHHLEDVDSQYIQMSILDHWYDYIHTCRFVSVSPSFSLWQESTAG